MAFEESSSITPHSSILVSQKNVTEFEKIISSVLNNCPSETIFLAAVSGGADSMAMLTAISASLCKEHLYCLHVEHGIRPPEESKGDADFVRDYCQNQKIKCSIVSIAAGRITSFAKKKGIGTEAAARFFRRKALFKHAKKLGENTRILIAHTRDDMLETALMRVLRGCGPAGLAAMPAEKIIKNRELNACDKRQSAIGNAQDGLILLRPLISMSREDVLCYLKAKGISWREDSTNSDEKFLRNRIRRRLVPLLNEAFPSWKTGVCGLAQTQSLAADFIADEAKKRVFWERENKKNSTLNFPDTGSCSQDTIHCFSTNEENFFAQPLIIREESLFIAIDELLNGKNNIKSIKRSVVRKFCSGNITAAELGPAQIRRQDGKVSLSIKQKEFFESGVSLLI